MKNEEMALLFSVATPYIQKYHGKTVVIKYGGNAMVNETLKDAVMNDLVTLTLLGVRVAARERVHLGQSVGLAQEVGKARQVRLQVRRGDAALDAEEWLR